jgi:Ca2+-dependent lipid-binding protein
VEPVSQFQLAIDCMDVTQLNWHAFPCRGPLVDPYVTLAFSRLGKPLFSTRIISGRSPVWEETAVVLVGSDAVAVREKLSLQVWDSDRVSADDVLGTVEIEMASKSEKPGS